MAGYSVVNEGSLKDLTFVLKPFNIRIEQGNFSMSAGLLLDQLDSGMP